MRNSKRRRRDKGEVAATEAPAASASAIPRSAPPSPAAARPRGPSGRSGILAYVIAPAITVLLGILVAMKFEWMNGAPYWRWAWRDLSLLRSVPVLLLGLLPFVAAQWLFARRQPRVALAGLTLSALALQFLLLGIAQNPFSLERMAGIIRSGDATSYFGDAQRFAKMPDMLAKYDELLPRTHGHTRTKGPGLVVFYGTMQRLAGDLQGAATAAGILIALVTALCVPATFLFARLLDASEDAAFSAASLLTLAPSLHLFFPMFDSCYPHFAMALFATWFLALRRDGFLWSALFGVTLAVSCFFAYNMLVVGVGLAALSLLAILDEPKRPLLRVAQHALVAVGAFVGCNLLLWLATGYDALATLRAALDMQSRILEHVERPYPATIFYDLTEFVQGTGYLPILLSLQFLLLRHGSAEESRRSLVVVFLCQFLAVALSAALPGETARVWLFLLPLAVYGGGLELARWPAAWRAVAYASVVATLAAIHSSMSFV